MRKRLLTVAGLALALLFAAPVAAQATPLDPPVQSSSSQDEIDRLLAEFPGGVQTGPLEITWGGGEAVLTLAPEPGGIVALAASVCPSSRFCAYSQANQNGSRLAFSSCTATNSVAPLGSVGSIGNSLSKTVYGYNGSTKRVTVSAGNSVNTSVTLTRLGC